MNKFAKVLLLSLIVSAPVAISAPAVFAKPVVTQQRMALNNAKKSNVKKHSIRRATRRHHARHAIRRHTAKAS